MIAGVVAFAILMVLMTVINSIVVGQDAEALTELATAVKNASPSGEETTKTFVLEKDTSIDWSDMANQTDLDKGSFIFTMGQLTDTDGIETDGTYLRYSGTSPKKRLMAKVICKQTNEDLANALDRLDSSKYDLGDAASGCEEDGIVCCVIIPMKPTK